MRTITGPGSRFGKAFLVCSLLASAGCSTPEQNIALGVVGATILGTRSASSEIEQIYYLGVFDPRDQLPPTVYRVRVHGQASAIGITRFASGWVRADVIDSLGTSVGFDKQSGAVKVTPASAEERAALQTGRRLVMFGPEGFREAPKDHRLVVVMGSDPEAFFQAIDQTLGIVAEAQAGKRNEALDRALFEALVLLRNERESLRLAQRDLEADIPSPKVTAAP